MAIGMQKPIAEEAIKKFLLITFSTTTQLIIFLPDSREQKN
jgi:hypothetical protein